MTTETLIGVFGDLDTYIYAFLTLVAWNFIWTKKLRNKVFGSGDDPTNDGLAQDVEDLENQVDDMEVQLKLLLHTIDELDEDDIDF